MASIGDALEGTRILLTGAAGQVGVALRQQAPDNIQLLSLDRQALDIRDISAVTKTVHEFRPDWIINAAAYTAVDRAEGEYETAFAINRDGAANLARAAESTGTRMVQISTDYVFDGRQGRPYRPDDTPNPLNVYGESKLAGEVAAREHLGDRAIVLRTAWVYAPHGKNFLVTMLRLMSERQELRVVDDQIGSPTHAVSLAQAILTAMAKKLSGTFHWTDAGTASWYDFAVAIQRAAVTAGLDVADCSIYPIPTAEYPTPATRPTFTVLDKTSTRAQLGYYGQHWQEWLASSIVLSPHQGGEPVIPSTRGGLPHHPRYGSPP